MKISIRVTVRGDDFVEHSYSIDEDQEPFSILLDPDDDRPDRPIEKVQAAAVRRTKEALQKLIRQAVER